MLKDFLVDRESWEVCEKVFVWFVLVFFKVNGWGMFMVLLKLGEFWVILFFEEYFGSVIYLWVLLFFVLVKFFLEMSDFIVKVDVFFFCMLLIGVSFVVNELKWESGFVFKRCLYMIMWILF